MAGIETSRIKPQFRSKLEAFQEELAPIAMRIFMHTMGISPIVTTEPASTVDPHLTPLIEHADLLLDVAMFLYQHQEAIGQIPGIALRLNEAVALMQSLAAESGEVKDAIVDLQNRLGLTPQQKHHVAEAVDRIVKDSVGKAGIITHAQIYAALRRKFKVSTYEDIAASRYEEVIQYLRDLWRRATSGETPEQRSLF